MNRALLVAVIVLALGVVIAVAVGAWRRRPYVIGVEHARAEAAEARRLARGTSAPSPMPKEEYGPGDGYLADPRPKPLDHALREVVAKYRTGDAAARAAMRDSISKDEIYTLFTFAMRAAVFGMRERDAAWIESGLTAVAMFTTERMDPRDMPVPLALLHHAGRRAGADTERLFRDTAALAEPEIAGAMAEFPRRDDTGLEKWLQAEIATGFIGRGIEPYAPAADLAKAIVAIAAVIDADGQYQVTSASIAEDLPAVWIDGSEPLLERARGGATIHTGAEKGLIVFLVELPDAGTAAALQELASRQKATANTAVAGVARGKLFCLIVASVFVLPNTLDETAATLQRFIPAVAEILDTVS